MLSTRPGDIIDIPELSDEILFYFYDRIKPIEKSGDIIYFKQFPKTALRKESFLTSGEKIRDRRPLEEVNGLCVTFHPFIRADDFRPTIADTIVQIDPDIREFICGFSMYDYKIATGKSFKKPRRPFIGFHAASMILYFRE